MNKKYGLLTLILLISIAIIFGYNRSYKVNQLDDVSLENKIDDDMFAIMIENDNGYEESNSNEWPDSTYIFNKDKSGCMDINGNKIEEEGILTFENNKATVSTSKTSYCYLYFDKKPITIQELLDSNPKNLNKTIQGGMWRYQGTSDVVDNNYICFGTSDKNECTSNPDIYMYRIIGIVGDTTDSTVSKNMVKVIKMTELKEGAVNTFQWHTSHWGEEYRNITWTKSNLFKRLNNISTGSVTGTKGDSAIFKGSSLYSYIDEDKWDKLVVDKKWYDGLLNYYYVNEINDLYQIETGQSESHWWNYDTLENGKWNLSATSYKISLMNLSDYFWSMSSNGTNCRVYSCKDSWLFFDTNHHEWFSTGHGGYVKSSEVSDAWNIVGLNNNAENIGLVARIDMDKENIIARPVFYLTSEILIKGTGTLNSPFIIQT